MTDLHTKRLTLIAVTDRCLELEADGSLPELPDVAITGWPPEHWEPHVFPYIQVQYAKHPETRGWHRYVVLNAIAGSGPLLIGTLGASPKGEGEAEFGYSILSAFQRQGYGTEAAQTFVDWLLSRPGVALVSAQTFPGLRGSIRVMEACGLEFAGAGEVPDTIRYARTAAGRPISLLESDLYKRTPSR